MRRSVKEGDQRRQRQSSNASFNALIMTLSLYLALIRSSVMTSSAKAGIELTQFS